MCLKFCNLALKFLILFSFIMYWHPLRKIVKVRASLNSKNLWSSIPEFLTCENFNILKKAQMQKFKWHLLCEALLDIHYSSSLIPQHFVFKSALYNIQPVITDEWYLHVCTPSKFALGGG